MTRQLYRSFWMSLLGVMLVSLTLQGFGFPALPGAPPEPGVKTETFKDRSAFFPRLQFQALPGKAIGVLVSDVGGVMSREGRRGPPNSLAFSVDGNSYHWMYVPVDSRPRITRLRVRVGPGGKRTEIYPQLDMANPNTINKWGITSLYALVEVEVNSGLGSPVAQAFVATKMEKLDGTAAYPLKLEEVVNELREREEMSLLKHQKAINRSLDAVVRKLFRGRKLPGKPQKTQLTYLTWITREKKLRVHIRTRFTKGISRLVGGGVRPGAFPRAFPGVRMGVRAGVELGNAYEVNATGKLLRILKLPLTTFTQEHSSPGKQ